MNNKVILSLFLLGLSFSFGPCLASCGPLLISYIAGTGKNVRRALVAYILFSAARITVYIILSCLFYLLSSFLLEGVLNKFSGFVYIAGGSFIVLIGIMMLFGRRLEIPYYKTNAFVFGLITGLLPCAALLSLLTYISLVSKTAVESLVYGACFGIGTFISPLVVLAVFAGAVPQFIMNKKPAYARVLNVVCGLIIILLGLQLIIGNIFKHA